VLAAILMPGLAWAQGYGPQPATTVQLPTYNFFTVSTSVSVPDRGATYLGGVNRAASGRNEFGAPFLPKNRSIGSTVSASGMQVSATIIDLTELDQQVLASGTTDLAGPAIAAHRNSGLAGPGVAGPGLVLPPAADPKQLRELQQAQHSSAGQAASSLSAIRGQQALAAAEQQKEAGDLFQKGQAAEVAGKKSVALVYYRMALRRSSGDFHEIIQAHIQSLGPASTRVAVSPGEAK